MFVLWFNHFCTYLSFHPTLLTYHGLNNHNILLLAGLERIAILFNTSPTECQTVWIQIRPNVLSGLIWVQAVCKSYQQTTLVVEELSHN